MYFDESVEAFDRPDRSTALIMGLCALLVVLFVGLPEPLLAGADTAAAALFPG